MAPLKTNTITEEIEDINNKYVIKEQVDLGERITSPNLEERPHPYINYSLFKLALIYTLEKIMLLIVALLHFIPTYLIFMGLSWKKYGLIDLICDTTSSNRFFILMFVGRFVFQQITGYFIGSNIFFNLIRVGKLLCNIIGVVSLCALLQIIFPMLFNKQFNQDGSKEISSSSTDKVLMTVAFIITDFINSAFWSILLHRKTKKKSKMSRIIIHIAKSEIKNVFMVWFLYTFMILVAVASMNPNISEDVRIFVFGIAFPIIKIIVVKILDVFAQSLAKGKKFNDEQTLKLVAQSAVVATVICTLSQLFVINQSCYDTSLFVLQYCPHELIKKFSWFTDHPSFVKSRMKIFDVIKDATHYCFKRRKKVLPSHDELPSSPPRSPSRNPSSGSFGKIRRYTHVVNKISKPTGNSVSARQAGEDFCMLVALFSTLSLFNTNCLYSISPLPISIVQPSNQEVILCALVIALTLESVTTIMTFVMLARAGIHVSYKYIPMDANGLGMNISQCVVLCLVLSAAMT